MLCAPPKNHYTKLHEQMEQDSFGPKYYSSSCPSGVPGFINGIVKVDEIQGVITYFETYYGQIATLRVSAGSDGTMDGLIPELADTLRSSVNITTIVRRNF